MRDVGNDYEDDDDNEEEKMMAEPAQSRFQDQLQPSKSDNDHYMVTIEKYSLRRSLPKKYLFYTQPKHKSNVVFWFCLKYKQLSYDFQHSPPLSGPHSAAGQSREQRERQIHPAVKLLKPQFVHLLINLQNSSPEFVKYQNQQTDEF